MVAGLRTRPEEVESLGGAEGRSEPRMDEGAKSPGVGGALGEVVAGARRRKSGDRGSRIFVSFFRPQMRSSKVRR